MSDAADDPPASTSASGIRGSAQLRNLVKKHAGALTTLGNLRAKGDSPFVFADDDEDRHGLKGVTYDSDSHVSVMLQMHGSIWPNVLPYCLANVLLTYCILWSKREGFDTTFPPDGHNFMAIMVSFLIVTRAQITYGRFMEARGYLSEIFRNCRELIHHAVVLSMRDTGRGAKQWRQDVAYRTILLLRVTIAALDYRTTNINTWEVVPEDIRHNLELFVSQDGQTPAGGGGAASPSQRHLQRDQPNARLMKWAHGVRTLNDENFRAPIILAYNLKSEIMKQRNGQYLTVPGMFHVNEELKMLGFVSGFVTAFHGLKKLITTPFPFPLVQMARTFLFFWIFTLPFALVRTIDDPIEVMLIVFFTTYGFIGLEYVSMELDDPFGDDPNDFDDLGMAQMVFEDIYITLYKADGSASAEKLRSKISERVKKGGALENYRRDLADDIDHSNTAGRAV
eukprot:CAMPEP_0183329318 /NCGR_PEP_ID=MMETSP0160_2-20130417/84734_1 /TAXON_ID=2839 ORGANISM="Odontella Sinensis, Strain Grunow 1884" /NCGR_SAMPLE_ID=MMETSP0160_2 /ASSEMBLY_ACC=CAM_ASM_000250 /LENGTH=451 /DNA_ID=CAMNT_0025497507 /DNA_START=30 /DNA_END=1385 /DNA_ORIENTATION=-